MEAIPLCPFVSAEDASVFALALFSKTEARPLVDLRQPISVTRISLHIERKLLTLVEIVHTSTLDRRNVNKHIGAAAVLDNKAVALLGIEELNGTCGH